VAFTYAELANVESTLQHEEEAAKNYRLALKLDPRLVSAHMGLAKIEERRRNYRVALAELDAVVRLDSGNASARYLRGQVLMRLGREKEGRTELDLLDADGNLLANHGFTWKDGAFTQFDFPGGAVTGIFGINARGDIVGVWLSDVSSEIEHGFACPKTEQCFSFDAPVPGTTLTQADEINAHGQIVGVYVDGDGVAHAFLMAGATFTSFDFPGATQTSAYGINSAGQIVGKYSNDDGSTHGFLAEPAQTGKPQ
jgi:probable HAF family extracellular repeat protein